MKKIVTVLTAALFVVALVSANAMAKGAKAPKGGAKGDEDTSVKGTLALVKNDKGEVTGVTITTKSGTVYNIDKAALTQDVSALDGKEVEAKGTVTAGADGASTLAVKGDIKAAGGEKKGGKKK